MGGINSSLNIAVNALIAQQGAMNVVSNNIANANTPGYTAERPNLIEQDPVQYGSVVLGQGAELQSVQSLRNQVLQLQIDTQTQNQGQLNSYLGGMDQVQSLFNETQGVGLQNVMSQFFNSFQSLSTDPTSTPLREGVLSAAQNLVNAFQTASSGLTQIQTGLDQSVGQTVTQVNQLTTQIAQVNQQIASFTGTSNDPSALVDQRDQLVNQLSQLVNVSVTNASSGSFEVTTSNGAALVVGNQSFSLSTKLNPATGFQDVYNSTGTDITSTISGGQLGGLIQARDQSIPAALNSLNTLAYNITSAVNTQNQAGYDGNGNAGSNFFTPLSGVAGAAEQMSVALTDPSQIAASSDGTAGDNANALALAGIQNQALIGGQTVTDYYSNLVDTVGNDVSNATSQQQTVNSVLTQLQNQQNSLSGVSIDQQAAMLVQYQNAYQASAQVVSVIQQLMQSTLNMM
jgi:flagellar hook-associated protein 1